VQKATVAILALGPAITALSSIVGTVTATISGLVAVFGGLSTIAGVVGTALTTLVGILGGPLTIALAAAGAAIVAYETNFLGFRDAVIGAVNKIKSVGAFLFGTGEGTLVGDTKAALNGLRQFVANSFDLQPLVDVFDNTINGIGDAFDRIDFSPLTNALDGISNGVQNLIDALNELAGVDIDVDVPSFDELLDEARSLVEPEIPERQDRDRGGGGGGRNPRGGPTDPNPRPGNDNPARGGGSDPGPGGFTPGIPGRLATGGLIESTGVATVHEGERVVPEAQVSDRGPAPVKGNGVTIENLTVQADSRSGGRAAGKALKRELKRFDI
jgi:hypothetical protein